MTAPKLRRISRACGVAAVLALGSFWACGDSPVAGGSPECTDSFALTEGGGWQVCDGEMFHRTAAAECSYILDARMDDGTDGSMLAAGSCREDNHCTEHPNGYCRGGSCTYSCVADSDCDSGQICFCLTRACISANCTTDAGCAGSNGCVATQTNAVGAPHVAACQSSADTCAVDSDCGPGQICLAAPGGRVCGPRPI